MTFNRVWPGGITNGQSPQGSELTELDLHVSGALDGSDGGAYSPSGAITVGGGGIQDANALDFVIASPATATKTVACGDAHAISVRFAERATERLIIDCDPSTDGVRRTIWVDNLLPTAKLEFESHGPADNWEWSNSSGAQRVRAELFLDSGQWRLVSVAAEPAAFAPALVAAPLPLDASGRMFLDLTSERTTITGNVSGRLMLHVPKPANALETARRTVFIERFIGGPDSFLAVVDDVSPHGGIVFTYLVNGAGFTNTQFEIFNDGQRWHVVPQREDRRRWGMRTISMFDGEMLVDPDTYSTMRVTGELREGAVPEQSNVDLRMRFVFPLPRNEADEFVIHFDSIMLTGAIGPVEFFERQDNGTDVRMHEPGAPLVLTTRNPESAEGLTGGQNIGFRFRVVDGHWRYYGAHL